MGESTQLLMCHVMHLYLQRSICLFKELDIHPGQAGLLWALNCKDQDHRGMAQKELAKHIGVKPPSITVMLKKLEAEAYIEKKQDENDQRIMRIFLTEKGKNIAAKMETVMEQLEQEAFANMNEQEVILFRRLLLQMRDNLKSAGRKED